MSDYYPFKKRLHQEDNGKHGVGYCRYTYWGYSTSEELKEIAMVSENGFGDIKTDIYKKGERPFENTLRILKRKGVEI